MAIEIKVTPERLRTAASDVEAKIQRLERVFSAIQQRIIFLSGQ